MTVKGLDWSFASVPPDQLPRWGYMYAFRYLCYDLPLTHGKILTKPELARILAVPGLDIFPNWEFYSTRCSEGARSGAADGAECHRQLVNLKWPAGRIVVYSNDTGSYNLAQCLKYHDAFVKACPGYDVRSYGGFDWVEDLYHYAGKKQWQTLAWSRGLISTHAFAYQNGNQAFNAGADEDIILDGSGSYFHGPAAQPPPHNPAPPPVTSPKKGKAMDYLHGVHDGPNNTVHTVWVIRADLTGKVLVADTITLSGLIQSRSYAKSPLTNAMVDKIPEIKG